MRRCSRMGRLAGLAAVAVVVALTTACGRPPSLVVSHTGDPGVPAPRTDASSAYDEANGTIVMFGGADRQGVLGETWTWDGRTWRRQHPTHVPPAREGALMAFDPAGKKIILLGGLTCPPPAPEDIIGCDYVATATHLSDTWSWDGADWSEIPTAHAPDVPYFLPEAAGLGTDRATGQVILLTWVKSVPASETAATWSFRDDDWHELRPKHEPRNMEFAGPAFDAVSGRLIVQESRGPHVDCGPAAPCPVPPTHDMTWAWDGSDWTDLGPNLNTPSDYGGLVEAGNHGVLLMGQFGSVQRWDGKTWGKAESGPFNDPMRTGWAASFDAATDQVVVFGGRSWETNHLYGDTFAWNGKRWSTAVEAAPSPSAPLALCSPKAADGGPGWERSPTDPQTGTYEASFVEPKSGPCHLDVVVHFALTDPAGKLLAVTGNPSQVRLTADLTFETGTWFARFTVTNECGLPQNTMATFSAGDLSLSMPATPGYCPPPVGPITITPGTLNRPAAK